jgi:sec-independent protein translocase protein TatC
VVFFYKKFALNFSMSDTTGNETTHTKKGRKEKRNYGEMSFLEHLEELRWHIIKSVIAICVFAVVAFLMKDFIFDAVILRPRLPEFWTNRMLYKLGEWIGTESLKINQVPLKLQSINISGQFSTHMWTAVIAGMILASPVIFWEFWNFIKPALYEKERKYAAGAVIYTSILFLTGVLFGYYLIVPFSIHFLGTYVVSSQVENQINLNSYISSVLSITLAAGVTFLLPIFSYFLSKVGILTPKFLKTYRRHAYVVLALLAAIITPPDVFSQCMVLIPLVILYEVSIIISRRVNKKREKAMKEI